MGARIRQRLMSFEEIVSSRREERRTRAQDYEDLIKDVGRLMKSTDEEDRLVVRSANEDLDFLNTRRERTDDEKRAYAEMISTKGVPSDQVAHDPTLSNISIMYANEEFIGVELMPYVGVPTKGAKYFEYNQSDRLAYPDDELNAEGEAHEISEKRSESNVACKTYGFQNRVDAETLQEQAEPMDEMVDMTQAVNEGLAFKEEGRIATIMQTSGNYATANKTTVGAGEKWDVGGNPVRLIKAGISAMWAGRGPSEIVGWCGRDVFDILCQHAGILELFKFAGPQGLATPEMIARMLGMDRLLVGSARQDTANSGQAARVYSRIWGNYFGMARVARNPTIRNASFGYSFQVNGDPITQEWFDPKKGKAGSYFVKVAADKDYKVVAADTGYLIINPLT